MQKLMLVCGVVLLTYTMLTKCLCCVVQYNDWKHDPLSGGTPVGAIASRADLSSSVRSSLDIYHPSHLIDAVVDVQDPVLHGGTDSKITSWALMHQGMQSRIYCGPTHDQQPVFTFDDWPQAVHTGTPQRFDFDWLTA